MKPEARRVESLLRTPAALRAVLLFGEDTGLVRSRANDLVRAAAGALDDPFRIAEVEPGGFGAIGTELASASLTGGRRVVRVRDADDGATDHVKAALAGPGEGLLVLEAGELTPRSRLRGLMERDKSDGVVAIGCYPQDARAVAGTVRSRLNEARIGIDPDALEWLAARLGADLALTLSEIDKLVLYAGPGGRIDLAAAQACVGDSSGLSLDDALHAATDGDMAEADRALELAMQEGAAPVGVLRAALLHVQFLQRLRLAIPPGGTPAAAVEAARVHFRRRPGVTRALDLWSTAALAAAAARLWETERACKRTGSADQAMARAAVLGLARHSAAARRRA